MLTAHETLTVLRVVIHLPHERLEGLLWQRMHKMKARAGL